MVLGNIWKELDGGSNIGHCPSEEVCWRITCLHCRPIHTTEVPLFPILSLLNQDVRLLLPCLPPHAFLPALWLYLVWWQLHRVFGCTKEALVHLLVSEGDDTAALRARCSGLTHRRSSATMTNELAQLRCTAFYLLSSWQGAGDLGPSQGFVQLRTGFPPVLFGQRLPC